MRQGLVGVRREGMFWGVGLSTPCYGKPMNAQAITALKAPETATMEQDSSRCASAAPGEMQVQAGLAVSYPECPVMFSRFDCILLQTGPLVPTEEVPDWRHRRESAA